ncbi:MAG TPA: DUF4032 domain-containing protein [Chloroflexi bacterium]|nr:DUF4032 domain-containing protein [Chloroflexota bacterium]
MPGENLTRLDFDAARRKAFWNEIVSFLMGRPNRLLSWKDVRDKLGIRGQIYRGIQAVPVDQIIGSVDRYRDFDRAFLPRHVHTAERWRSIDRAYYDDVSLPPVKLYRIGDVYFVLDGNHRVSVARERGIEFVDAEVIEAETRVPVTPDLDADDLEIKGEYARFLERTRLDELRPDQNIQFTIGGGYERLLEHIAVHRHFLGLEWQRYFSEDEAVCDWYDQLYLPLVQIIREQDVLSDFPGRTAADLYLWIMDHRHYLREQFGGDVAVEQAAQHFADHYTTRPIKRVLHVVQDLVTGQKDEEAFDADSAPGGSVA